eukprot:10727084-Heterocapsa_arctica.AAC.1
MVVWIDPPRVYVLGGVKARVRVSVWKVVMGGGVLSGSGGGRVFFLLVVEEVGGSFNPEDLVVV